MCETDDATFSSTALSVSNLTVQRWYLFGAAEHARAMSRASKAPSNMTSRGGLSRGNRSRAASSPSSTKRFLRCSMVRDVTPNASAASATVHAGPSEPASHNNNARAWMNFLAPVFPSRVNASRSLRSCSVREIRYLGGLATSFGCHQYIAR